MFFCCYYGRSPFAKTSTKIGMYIRVEINITSLSENIAKQKFRRLLF